MEYNRLGRSTTSVSKICLGTMHFGPKADEAESHKILDRAVEMGITFIDTANVYGGDAGKGRSEEIIGIWFAARPGIRDEVVLATKVYHPMGDLGPANDHTGFSAYKVRQHLAASLRRLQTDRIDLYQVHHIDEQVSAEELWGTFERVVADGDVLYAGVEQPLRLGPGQAPDAGMAARLRRLRLRADPVQPAQPGARDGGAARGAGLRHWGAGLHAAGRRSADRQDRIARRDAHPAGRGGVRNPGSGSENRQFADFGELCRAIGEPERIVATAWVLQHPAVVSAIVGVRTVDQLVRSGPGRRPAARRRGDDAPRRDLQHQRRPPDRSRPVARGAFLVVGHLPLEGEPVRVMKNDRVDATRSSPTTSRPDRY